VEFVLQQAVNGLAYGFAVVLLGLGFTLVFGTSRLINFAQGEVYMLGAFIGAAAATMVGEAAPPALALAVALIAGTVVPAVFNVLMYYVVFWRIRNLPMITTLLAGLGSSLVVRGAAGQLFGVEQRGFPELPVATGLIHIGGVSLQLKVFLVGGLAIAFVIAGYWLLFRTGLGLRIRALSDSAEGTQAIGVDISRLQAVIFALAGALSGAAGVMLGWHYGLVVFNMGTTAVAAAFVATVIGGLGSLNGALIGGLAVGLSQGLGTAVNSQYQIAYPFVLLIVFLLFRPTGFFGRKLGFH
jgi:branched-chain amino acid transport system permease protein